MAAPQKAKANPVAPGSAIWTSQSTQEFTPEQPEQKAWARFRANCALIGVSAWRSHEDGKTLFIVSRYGRTREFCDMQDAARWIALVSGVRHE
jgi:hypothetical protein